MSAIFPRDWYWIVGGDETQAYGSARGGYALANDTSYGQWLATGARPSRIVSETELGEVLVGNGLSAGSLPAPRRELPKSTVAARVNALSKLGAVFALLNSQPLLFAQWFTPDWPNVYVDDPGLLQVLAASGLTHDEIATVTA